MLPVPRLVSVIIPCYNAERFLSETLQSAFEQTYPHIEIIVVDDGSTDRSAALIRSYDDRLRAEFGPNRGVSAARNRGTTLATGEFIQYLDADDLLTPNSIERRVEALQKSGADIAYSDWERLVEIEPGVFRASEQIVRRIEDVHLNVLVALITSFWAPPAAITYRRAIVEKIGGWKEWLPIIQDARFLQDAGLVGGTFVYVAGIGAQYREHFGGSVSTRSKADFVLDVFRNATDLQSTLESRGSITAEERHAFARIYDYVSRSLFFLDRSAFGDCVKRLYAVEPGFQLSWPKAARASSLLFGYSATKLFLAGLQELRRLQRDTSM